MKKLALITLLSILVSCTNKSNSELILGSWSLHVAKANFVMNLNFIDKKTLKVNLKENDKDEVHTMNYALIDNGKKLVTTEKNGDVEEFQVAKLTINNLILIKVNDTLDFKKD